MSPRPQPSFQRKLESQADAPDDRDASLSSHDEKEAEAGFTLVELMVVIVILGLLTTLVVINVMPSQDLAMRKKAEADIATIGQALEMYRVSNMTYPTSAQGLAVLAGQSGTIRRLPDDPWGRPYQYANPGPNGGVDVYSLGADGQPGGEGENADIRLAQ
ncbi:type II secretion system major pseudopilin GspG [Sphingomonas aestuarii]